MPVVIDYVRAVRSFSPNARRYLTFTVFNAVSWNAFGLTFNLYLHSLGYRQDFIGLLNGLPFVVVLALGLPIGMAADRCGYLRFLVSGSVLAAVSALGTGLSSGRLALLGFSLAGGLASSLSWVIGAPMLMAISTKEERVFLFSVQSALMMAAGFLGSLMAGALPEIAARALGVPATATTPLRLTYLVGASFNVVAVLPILRMAQVKGNGGGPAGARSRPLPSSWPELGLFMKLLGPSALISFGAGAMVVFFQLFFNLKFGLGPGRIGVLFAFSSVVTAAATLVSPVLAARVGKVRAIFWTEMASIPFLLILAYSGNLTAVVVAYYLRSALMNMSSPLQTTFGLEQVKEEQRATLTSLQAMLGSLGRGGLGPIVSGFLQVKSGFSLAFTLTAVCYVVGGGLFYLFFRGSEGRRTATGPLPADGLGPGSGPSPASSPPPARARSPGRGAG